jgi:formate dehydrogenase iron-sulfur subunit
MSANLIALQNRFLGQGETVYDRLARLREDKGALADDDLLALAKELKLPPAHVRTVAKFYDELKTSAPSKVALRVCNGEACEVAGAEGCRQRIAGADIGDDVEVGYITCVGYCGSGPNALVQIGHEEAVVSLRDRGLDAVVAAAKKGVLPELEEPKNALFDPPEEKNVLMRFMRAAPGLEGAKAAGAYRALDEARKMEPQAVIDEVKASKIRGRGGAGFPAGIKLQTVRDAPSKKGRVVVLNADEGDAGAYIDKELMERAPHTVIEGMAIAAHAVGATEAIVYLRGEYPTCHGIWTKAVKDAEEAGLLGDLEIRTVRGHGAYICGEETSLLRSLEGVPAQVSPKPPYPAVEGLRGAPTLVNNVETLAAFPYIVSEGGAAYAALGHGESRGTKLVSLNTAVAKPGLYEVELGTSLRTLLFELAGGMADGKEFKAAQIGGPLGGIFGEQHLDVPMTFEDLAAAGGMLGHAGIVVYGDDVDLVKIGRGLMKFCAIESCGKCFPCRIGSVRGTELFDKILAGEGSQSDIDLLAELDETMRVGSLCALGGAIPMPIDNLLAWFIGDFREYVPDAKTPAMVAARYEVKR